MVFSRFPRASHMGGSVMVPVKSTYWGFTMEGSLRTQRMRMLSSSSSRPSSIRVMSKWPDGWPAETVIYACAPGMKST